MPINKFPFASNLLLSTPPVLNPKMSEPKFIGLVAQEAETVCPSLVKSQPDLGENNEDLGTETKVLKYSILYMKAIKALQEAQARIETLETKVAALEAG